MTAAPIKPSTPEIIEIAAGNLFRVLRENCRSYCLLTSAVIQGTLENFGIPAELMACQLIVMDGVRTAFIGFSGAREDQWDGHVVTRVGRTLIDCATGGLAKAYGIDAPPYVIARSLDVPSTIHARALVGPDKVMVWAAPPLPGEVEIPPEPETLVSKAVARLTRLVSDQLGIGQA